MAFFSDKRAFNLLVISIAKWQVKLILAMIAFAIVISVFLFTRSLSKELIKREQDAAGLYAKLIEDFLDSVEKSAGVSDTDIFLFFLDEIQQTMINFPIIVTYENGEPYEPFESWTLNVNYYPDKPIEEQRVIVKEILKKMQDSYHPILVKDKEGKVISKIYYTHSELVDKLRFFPFIGLIVIAAFIIIGYISFNSSRDNEQSKIWVGMAKEAAHQLGTPLSSLLAWLEIIKFSSDNPQYVQETAAEMEKDIQRLNTIAIRFSKIGSTPEKEYVNLSKLIDNVCNYYDKRLPHLGKKIEIIRSLDESMFAEVNVDLFAWVFENLLKNAAEAIEEKTGQIYIYMRVQAQKKIYIFVQDTGKGMNQTTKRQLFSPGYTTKKRGWGLGLSLCKRIIEEYHNGKIYVKETVIGKGTTFAIELPITKPN